MFVLVFLCVLPPATSFLIDVSTPIPPNVGTFITDGHYNALMDLFIQERYSRRNLEKYVIQLSQKMTEMAKDIASTKTKMGAIETLDHEFESKIDIINQTLIAKITENNRRVALTACVAPVSTKIGDVVKFPNVYSNYGIQNITLFKQTGIFTCEQKGLYMFFASMSSAVSAGYFRWYFNSKPLSVAYTGEHGSVFRSASGMMAVDLIVGDTVALKSETITSVHSHSCYTLIKIK